MSFPFPEINASLNACSTVCLTAGYAFIRSKKVWQHRACMLLALFFSVIFLGFYLVYHWQTGAKTPFKGEGVWRPVYYTILITHVVLAAVIVPLIIQTLRLALLGNFIKHRVWAKWTYPLWYYVSVTGVLVYWFLYQF